MSDWLVNQGGRQFGPYSDEELAAYVQDGSVQADAIVWCEGMTEWVPVGQVISPSVTEEPPLAAVVTEYTTPRAMPQRDGWLTRHKHYCGTRSFIFQTLLVGWTVAVGCWMLAAGFNIASEMNRGPYGLDNDAAATALGVSWICLIGGWFVIAFPLFIAAIATLERNPPTRRVR